MLYEVMKRVNNYFVKTKVEGKFTISDGKLDSSFISENQYFMIDGSVFNDGVYQKGSEELTDETFVGEVSALAIPKAFLDLVKEIENWNEKYADTAQSPFQSESFGGYTYSKKSDSAENGDGNSWQTAFKSKLSIWRKL